MDQVLAAIEQHGALIVFAVLFVDQLGVPLPTVPVLLMLGALAGSGRIDPFVGLFAATTGCLCADYAWFVLGRLKGSLALGLMCRFSLEPDTCVDKTRGMFARYGVKSLLVAKFVPGYDTVAPPLAGLLGVRTIPFLLWSIAGAVLWLLAFCGLGYLFSGSISELAAYAENFGHALGLAIAALCGGYVAWKFFQRQRVLRALRVARITPDELHALILGGCAPTIVDTRGGPALAADPFVLPGAQLISFDEVEARYGEIPRDVDVIVYCSCPNEVTAARVALKLQRLGISRVRPLLGGIDAWRSRRFPVVSLHRADEPVVGHSVAEQ